MTSFSNMLATFLPGHAVVLPGSWKQGRTAFGGLSAALCVEAARRALPDLPALRSLQVLFTGPVMGDPVFRAHELRRGRNVTGVGVEATVEGAPVANATLVFGAARESAVVADLDAPDVAAPGECESFIPEGAESFAPGFFGNFEVVLAGGHRPVSEAGEGHFLCWARHRDAASRDGESAFVCLGDVLPPSAFAVMGHLAPISSVNWQLNLLRASTTTDGWYLVESRQTAARDGYSSQVMRYWNADGQLVAEGMQAVAVFG